MVVLNDCRVSNNHPLGVASKTQSPFYAEIATAGNLRKLRCSSADHFGKELGCRKRQA